MWLASGSASGCQAATKLTFLGAFPNLTASIPHIPSAEYVTESASSLWSLPVPRSVSLDRASQQLMAADEMFPILCNSVYHIFNHIGHASNKISKEFVKLDMFRLSSKLEKR